MNTFSPIVLFAYNRADHLRRTIEALKANSEARGTALTVFCDGPKDGILTNEIEEVRQYVGSIDGFGSVQVVLRDRNLGLSKSIISGVSQVLLDSETVIVLEDDIVVSPYFLQYMNDALKIYANHEKVASIHGYVYPVKKKLPSTFFLKGADCWGWATWKRAWKYFEPDGILLEKQLVKRNLLAEFDFNGTASYSEMLRRQIAGKNDSWAIRWYASAFLNDLYTLYPGKSLVLNIGLDGTGTHCSDESESFGTQVQQTPVDVKVQKVERSLRAFREFSSYFRNLSRPRIGVAAWGKFRSKVRNFVVSRLKKLFGFGLNQVTREEIGWVGSYESWAEASKHCTGYDSQKVLEKVHAASLKVKNGEAVFERDSVLFDHIEYSWPVTAYLAKIALDFDGHLHVLDFGGALGSHFYQNHLFLESVKDLKWVVVEQRQFVEIGKREFTSANLSFAYTIAEASKETRFDAVLLSSVLPYIEDYGAILAELVELRVPYLIIDRTLIGSQEAIKVQNIPAAIYEASYVCRVLTRERVLEKMLPTYQLLYEFDSFDGLLFDDVYCKGFVFKLKP